MLFYATDHDDAAAQAERLINDAGFDPVRTGTLARTEAGHQEPKGDLYGEEFHHDGGDGPFAAWGASDAAWLRTALSSAPGMVGPGIVEALVRTGALGR